MKCIPTALGSVIAKTSCGRQTRSEGMSIVSLVPLPKVARRDRSACSLPLAFGLLVPRKCAYTLRSMLEEPVRRAGLSQAF